MIGDPVVALPLRDPRLDAARGNDGRTHTVRGELAREAPSKAT